MTSQSIITRPASLEPGSRMIPDSITVSFSLAKGFINVSNLRRQEVEIALDVVLKALLTSVAGAVLIEGLEE